MWLQCVHGGKCYFIACCYHPPKPNYHHQMFIDALSHEIDYAYAISLHGESVVIKCGNSKSLSTEFLEVDHGFVQLVSNQLMVLV